MLFKKTTYVDLIEVPSFLKMLGDVKGKDVVDLACGSGFYTAMIRERTEGVVYGVDLSPMFIEVAKRHHQNIDFVIADC